MADGLRMSLATGRLPYSGILRDANGNPAIRLYSQMGLRQPNQLTVEFQDEFNQYQQDSLTLVDVDDSLLTEQNRHCAISRE